MKLIRSLSGIFLLFLVSAPIFAASSENAISFTSNLSDFVSNIMDTENDIKKLARNFFIVVCLIYVLFEILHFISVGLDLLRLIILIIALSLGTGIMASYDYFTSSLWTLSEASADEIQFIAVKSKDPLAIPVYIAGLFESVRTDEFGTEESTSDNTSEGGAIDVPSWGDYDPEWANIDGINNDYGVPFTGFDNVPNSVNNQGIDAVNAWLAQQDELRYKIIIAKRKEAIANGTILGFAGSSGATNLEESNGIVDSIMGVVANPIDSIKQGFMVTVYIVATGFIVGLAKILALFNLWCYAIIKIVGLFFIPFMVWEGTRTYFMSWFKALLAVIFFNIILRIILVVFLFQIKANFDSIPGLAAPEFSGSLESGSTIASAMLTYPDFVAFVGLVIGDCLLAFFALALAGYFASTLTGGGNGVSAINGGIRSAASMARGKFI